MDVAELLTAAGRTYADEAGIGLADSPAPLYQLSMLTVLLSTRISAEIGVAACRELIELGCTTADRTRRTTWQQRVDALGRAHYTRYDESTATRLAEGADLLHDRFGGDLRSLDGVSDCDASAVAKSLQAIPGIGPVGAEIFLREVQAVWPWLRPYLGSRASDAAKQLGLPHTAAGLARQAGTDDLSVVTAALVRVHIDPSLLPG